MRTWRFSLIIEGRDLDDDEVLDALFDAGCSDALFGGSNGVQCADFHRDAERVEDAVISAIEEVESVGGVQVVGLIEQELVTAEEIANRSGRPFEDVRSLIDGNAGPGRFPKPYADPRRAFPVWHWSDVAHWLVHGPGERSLDADQQTFNALARAVEARNELRKTPSDRRARIDEFIHAAGGVAAGS